MAKINLLPWREERRKQREREFYGLLGVSFAAAAIVAFVVVSYFSGQIDGQRTRNAYLETQIKEMDVKIKQIQDLEKTRTKLLQRKQAIEELQANRSQMVHLFDDLVRTIPDGVRLVSIKQNGDQLVLQGQAESNARVSNYMRNLEASTWMTAPDLDIVEARGAAKRDRYTFTLRVAIRKPQAVDAVEQQAAPKVALAEGSKP